MSVTAVFQQVRRGKVCDPACVGLTVRVWEHAITSSGMIRLSAEVGIENPGAERRIALLARGFRGHID